MTQWINDRMNRDNFWNLMFWFLISSIFGISLTIDENDAVLGDNTILGDILYFGSIIFVVYLVKKNAKVTFDQERFFLNSRGEELFEKCPNFVLTTLGSCGAFALFIKLKQLCFNHFNESLLLLLAFSIFLLTFVSFFIYRNCPIPILFDRNFWKPNLEFEVKKNTDGSTSITKKRNPLHRSWNIKIRNLNSSDRDITNI